MKISLVFLLLLAFSNLVVAEEKVSSDKIEKLICVDAQHDGQSTQERMETALGVEELIAPKKKLKKFSDPVSVVGLGNKGQICVKATYQRSPR